MSIYEELKFISKTLASEKFQSVIEAVSVFRAFLKKPQILTIFKWLESRTIFRSTGQKIFLLRRILEVKRDKANVFRDEFVRVFDKLENIFLDILDLEDLDGDIEEDAILVDNFYSTVKKLDKVLLDFKDLRMYGWEEFHRLFKMVIVNEEEEVG